MMRERSVIQKRTPASVIAPDMPQSVVKTEGIPAFSNGAPRQELDSNLFYNFFQQTNQLAWIVDDEGTLLFASKAFFRYFDIDEKQCINQNVIATIPIAVTHSLYELHRRVSSTGHSAETTQRIRLADGNSLICHLNLFSLGMLNGKKLVGGQATRLPDTSELEKKFQQAQERLLTLNLTTSALEDKLAVEKVKRQKEISEIMVKAQETERTRIGIELHDNVNQILSATKLFVDYLTPIGREQRLVKQKSIEYIQLTIDEIRKLSKELVAPSLTEKGLVQSIRGLVEDIEMVDAMKIRFEHNEENDQVSNGKKVAIFRIAQEQLKNILKHSQAKNTMISLFTGDEQVKMVIADDGDGFNPQQTYQGIGLGNIRERVNFYNGTVDIQSAKGHGCKLTVIFPAGDE